MLKGLIFVYKYLFISYHSYHSVVSSHCCEVELLGTFARDSSLFLGILEGKFLGKLYVKFERSDRFQPEKL